MNSIKFVFVCVSIVFQFAIAQNPVIESENGSYIQYIIRHPLHTVKATNNEPKFLIEYDAKEKKILRAEGVAEVVKFNSGNSNRDSHVMEVVEALRYPKISFKSNDIKLNGEDLLVSGFLTFHGETKEITMKGKAKFEGNLLVVDGSFQISLTEFKVKRPTLLFIPTEDSLKIIIHAKFNLPN